MKPYSIDFREKIVNAYEHGDTSIRKLATRFDVSKGLVQRLLKQKQMVGHVAPRKQGGSMKSTLHASETQLAEMVEKYPDITMAEYCEYWGETHQQWVSPSYDVPSVAEAKLNAKKKTMRSSQSATERVQTLHW